MECIQTIWVTYYSGSWWDMPSDSILSWAFENKRVWRKGLTDLKGHWKIFYEQGAKGGTEVIWWTLVPMCVFPDQVRCCPTRLLQLGQRTFAIHLAVQVCGSWEAAESLLTDYKSVRSELSSHNFKITYNFWYRPHRCWWADLCAACTPWVMEQRSFCRQVEAAQLEGIVQLDWSFTATENMVLRWSTK